MAFLSASGVFSSDHTGVRLAASLAADMQNPVFSDPVATYRRVAVATIEGLDPATVYHLAWEVEGHMILADVRPARTFPEGPASFRFGWASCVASAGDGRGGDPAILSAISQRDLDLFFQLGDLHYHNNRATVATVAERMDSLRKTLRGPNALAGYGRVRTFYMWDDHDSVYGELIGGRYITDKSAPAWDAARESVRRWWPNPPTALPGITDPFYYAVSVGRIHFIMTDLHSLRDPEDATDDASKSMLGTAQKDWFKEQLDHAKAEGLSPIWMTTKPLNGALYDSWPGYSTERREIFDYVKSNGLVGKMCALSGDRHFAAFDDGSNTDYATGGGCPMVTMTSAPLWGQQNNNDGTYSGGIIGVGTGGGQYSQFSEIDVVDDGSAEISLTARTYRAASYSDPTLTLMGTYNWLLQVP